MMSIMSCGHGFPGIGLDERTLTSITKTPPIIDPPTDPAKAARSGIHQRVALLGQLHHSHVSGRTLDQGCHRRWTFAHHEVAGDLLQLPPAMRKSLTWGRGRQIAEHQEVAAHLQMDVHFCDPRGRSLL
jgi:hypothetical protein